VAGKSWRLQEIQLYNWWIFHVGLPVTHHVSSCFGVNISLGVRRICLKIKGIPRNPIIFPRVQYQNIGVSASFLDKRTKDLPVEGAGDWITSEAMG